MFHYHYIHATIPVFNCISCALIYLHSLVRSFLHGMFVHVIVALRCSALSFGISHFDDGIVHQRRSFITFRHKAAQTSPLPAVISHRPRPRTRFVLSAISSLVERVRLMCFGSFSSSPPSRNRSSSHCVDRLWLHGLCIVLVGPRPQCVQPPPPEMAWSTDHRHGRRPIIARTWIRDAVVRLVSRVAL